MRGGLRRSMAWLHTWAGLPVGWVLFFVFLTGTLGYFDSEIDQWMRPEAPLPSPALSQVDGLALALARLEQVAPRAPQWTVFPPSGHDVPHVTIGWSAGADASGRPLRRSETLDAATGAPFRARATGGGQTLYQLHYTLHYLPSAAARWLVGICSMLMLVALVSGVITHKRIFADFFTFRPGQGQRSWLDAHNLAGVAALPFHLVITYSGLVFFVFTYMSPVVDATYGRDGRGRFFDEAFRNPEIPPPADVPAPLAPLTSMYGVAERRWGEAPVRVASIYNPGDRNARVVFTGTHVDPVSNGGRMVFAGATGELIGGFDRRTGPMAVNHALLGLHEGLFAGPVLRWLYFLAGLLGNRHDRDRPGALDGQAEGAAGCGRRRAADCRAGDRASQRGHHRRIAGRDCGLLLGQSAPAGRDGGPGGLGGPRPVPRVAGDARAAVAAAVGARVARLAPAGGVRLRCAARAERAHHGPAPGGFDSRRRVGAGRVRPGVPGGRPRLCGRGPRPAPEGRRRARRGCRRGPSRRRNGRRPHAGAASGRVRSGMSAPHSASTLAPPAASGGRL